MQAFNAWSLGESPTFFHHNMPIFSTAAYTGGHTAGKHRRGVLSHDSNRAAEPVSLIRARRITYATTQAWMVQIHRCQRANQPFEGNCSRATHAVVPPGGSADAANAAAAC